MAPKPTLPDKLRSLADCDARAGAPLGKELRHWADFIEAVLEQSPNGEPVEIAIHPNGDWSVYANVEGRGPKCKPGAIDQ